MDILERSWQDLNKILEQSWLRSCQDFAMVFILVFIKRAMFPRKNFVVKSFLVRKNLKGRKQKSTSMQIHFVRHGNFVSMV